VNATLHPLLAHHVLNSLGWADLRPLQKAALGPITAGQHVLLVAPTAGGKTEAAIFPIISRMLSEDWQPMSVLYLCPLRALLNNLHPRIEQYASLVGRRAGLWHGDVGESAREAIRDDPPDILLTTPESIEAMLISRKTDHEHVFRRLRVLVVDEIHAFAGDDRGWHLLAVAERVQRLAGRELQRVGLSATIGNAGDILAWLTRTSRGPRTVIVPPGGAAPARPDVTVDYVGALDNAATVISRLHRGEKRLVFVDSRARAEQLAADLRDRDVQTFVSHGSLGREERHAAEAAFASSRDCVIVATSTLELGIDVGDLDRVIQIDAPATVASFLQRLGRTGRREGATSNTLFLATREDTFLHTLGLLTAWEEGYVEPLEPPPLPLHLVVQQLLALVLQEGGVGRKTWMDWLGDPFIFGDEAAGHVDALTRSLIAEGFLFDDSGILGMGERGERTFGGRNFLDLMAVFSEPPMLKVMAGRTELGQVPLRLLTLEAPDGQVLLLAGRDWRVLHIDWRRGVVEVEPGQQRGKARWFGEGRGLSFSICQGVKRSLAGGALQQARLSKRAAERLEEVRDELHWVTDEPETVVVREPDGTQRWWTFAGVTANAWLANGLGKFADQVAPGDLNIRLSLAADAAELAGRLSELDPGHLRLGETVSRGAVERLKFAEALPHEYARLVVEKRMREDDVVHAVARSNVRVATVPAA
jgi:ATP-dependent helicase Lhr and Lhr-like helicase